MTTLIFLGPTKHRIFRIWRSNGESVSKSRFSVRGSYKCQRRDTIRSKRLQRSLRDNRIAATKSLRALRRAAHQRQEENSEPYVRRMFRIVSNEEQISNIECKDLTTYIRWSFFNTIFEDLRILRNVQTFVKDDSRFWNFNNDLTIRNNLEESCPKAHQ